MVLRRVAMKSIVIQQHGDPSVLQYMETAEPQIRPNEVLVRVRMVLPPVK